MQKNFVSHHTTSWSNTSTVGRYARTTTQRGEERFREEGEMAQKMGRKEKGRKKIGRQENQHEKGEGRMS